MSSFWHIKKVRKAADGLGSNTFYLILILILAPAFIGIPAIIRIFYLTPLNPRLLLESGYYWRPGYYEREDGIRPISPSV